MILANITTWTGQCADAEHYYCRYNQVDSTNVPRIFSYGHEDLYYTTTVEDAKSLTKKDGYNFRTGRKSSRFASIEKIHNTLIEMFPNEDIITYYESEPFKETLYIINGKDLGYKGFGENWNHFPKSVYKDLLPELSSIKIKCGDCGTEFDINDIMFETEHLGRPLIKFDLELIDCCKYKALVWNVVL